MREHTSYSDSPREDISRERAPRYFVFNEEVQVGRTGSKKEYEIYVVFGPSGELNYDVALATPEYNPLLPLDILNERFLRAVEEAIDRELRKTPEYAPYSGSFR